MASSGQYREMWENLEHCFNCGSDVLAIFDHDPEQIVKTVWTCPLCGEMEEVFYE